MRGYYKLVGKVAVPCADVLEWARWLEANPDAKIVKQENVGGFHVSTVFLGLDHAWGGGTPLLFETMVFGGPGDQSQDRYSTWDEAMAGHIATVEKWRTQ